MNGYGAHYLETTTSIHNFRHAAHAINQWSNQLIVDVALVLLQGCQHFLPGGKDISSGIRHRSYQGKLA